MSTSEYFGVSLGMIYEGDCTEPLTVMWGFLHFELIGDYDIRTIVIIVQHCSYHHHQSCQCDNFDN